MALISLGSNKITSTKRHKTAPYIPREREREERTKKPAGGKRKGYVFPSHHRSAVTAARLVGWMGASRFIGLLACPDQPPRFFFFLLLPSSSPRAHHDGKGGRHLGISRLRCSPSLLSRPRERRACDRDPKATTTRSSPATFLGLEAPPPPPPNLFPPPSLPKRPI